MYISFYSYFDEVSGFKISSQNSITLKDIECQRNVKDIINTLKSMRKIALFLIILLFLKEKGNIM